METKNQIVKKQSETPMFYDSAMETLDKALEWAKLMLDSKMLPKHFYDTKTENGKSVIDYSSGNPGAVLMVIQHGQTLGLSPSQAVQQVVPVNNVMSVKGDGCKALILGSGKCETWKEEITGSIDTGDYKVTIYSKRKDNGEERTDYFDLKKAKRAGLYFSDDDLKRMQENRQYAYKFTGWYKYPERMVRYRVLGFIARDLYADVMGGTVTYEEAIDYPEDKVEVLAQEGKKALVIDHGKIDHLTDKVNKASEKIANKKEQFSNQQKIEDVEEIKEERDPITDTNEPEVSVEGSSTEDLKPDNTFDEKKEEKEFVIPSFAASGKRTVRDKISLNDHLNRNGLNKDNYSENTKGTRLFQKYTDLEHFCERAQEDEIQILLNKLKK